MPKEVKRIGLRGGRDAAQSDFGGGSGEVGSDAGFDNDSPSRVTEITIGDAPTVFDINKVGDPSQNPNSKNVRGDDRFSGYTPSFATPPSFFNKAISKSKSFVKFVSPFLVNAAFGTFVPSKVKKGIALFNLAKNIDTIQDMTTQDVLEEDVTLAPDGRTGFRGGDAARSDAASGRDAGRSDPSGGVDRGSSNRDRAMGSGGKRKGGTNTSRGSRDRKITTLTPTKSKYNIKSNIYNQLEKLANLDKISKLEAKAISKTNLPSATGVVSDARHLSAMNELSKSLSPFGGKVGEFIGDIGAFGIGLVNEIPALGKGLNKQNLGEIKEDIAANFGVFSTPQTTTAEQIYASKGLKDGGQPKKIPIRSNKYGVKELDYRKSGGFVPIGVKEKADDVPAMLSKNEFVFTADAVRGAGNGSINKGAQKMYNLMKNLEARRV